MFNLYAAGFKVLALLSVSRWVTFLGTNNTFQFSSSLLQWFVTQKHSQGNWSSLYPWKSARNILECSKTVDPLHSVKSFKQLNGSWILTDVVLSDLANNFEQSFTTLEKICSFFYINFSFFYWTAWCFTRYQTYMYFEATVILLNSKMAILSVLLSLFVIYMNLHKTHPDWSDCILSKLKF